MTDKRNAGSFSFGDALLLVAVGMVLPVVVMVLFTLFGIIKFEIDSPATRLSEHITSLYLQQRSTIDGQVEFFNTIQNAIESKKDENGNYPISAQIDDEDQVGVSTYEFERLEKVFPDLAGDVRRLNLPDGHRVLYLSDGTAYKVLIYDPQLCFFVYATDPDLRDPIRNGEDATSACTHYGIWSEQGQDL